MAQGQLTEIVSLQDHVVEFDKAQRLFPLEPQLDRIERQHAVDREMRPHGAQQIDVAQLAEPLVIIDHDRVGRAIAEGQEPLEDGADRGDVGRDALGREHLAAFVLARGIADLGGPSAHHHDRLVPGLLQAAQHHDLHQAADVERWRRRVEADIARDDLGRGQLVEPGGIGELVDVATFVEQAEQRGGVGHVGSRSGGRA